MAEVIYECIKCGKRAPKEEGWERTPHVFKCPACGYRVSRKVRPPIVKHVKAR